MSYTNTFYFYTSLSIYQQTKQHIKKTGVRSVSKGRVVLHRRRQRKSVTVLRKSSWKVTMAYRKGVKACVVLERERGAMLKFPDDGR